MIKNFFAALIAAASMIALASPAAAASQHEPQSVLVRYADLDLNTQRGADRMLMRVQRAARGVCGQQFGLYSPGLRRAISHCVDETVATTVSRLDHPMVSARFIQRFEPSRTILQAGEPARAG